MSAIAIVIDDPFAPSAAEGGVIVARKDDGVLDRNDALVVVAIERPGLQLRAGELAFVHQQMERMAMVVSLRADRAQVGFQFNRRGWP